PPLAPETAGELRTLGQIVAHLAPAAPAPVATPVASAPVAAPAPAVAPAPVATPAVAPAPPAASGDPRVQQALFEVVADKTGYPVSTLEPDMDLEADLGIDSIKRVEILGALQDRLPDLPPLAPETAGELRTLGQIVAHLAPAAPAPVATPAPAVVPTAVPASVTSNGNGNGSVAYGAVRLQHLPTPDRLELQLPDGYTCVITDDGTPMSVKLAQLIAAEGWNVVLLRFPTTVVAERSPIPPSIGRVVLADMSEDHLAQAFGGIAAGYGPIGAFIHLHPLLSNTNDSAIEAQKAIVRHVFLAARHLKAPLTEAATLSAACFLTVTRIDGQLGLETADPVSSISGGLFGLTKTLRQEWPLVYCRAIDLSPALAPEQAAHQIIAELHDANRLVAEVGYGAQGRVTLAVEKTRN
ncbi:MAG TPA: phosphopantetheine-binding protein, partial [Roseiflexaceae bacterium]|nr:phosphopantetheine-binding protein [Roseiflexaceae bacterium]